MSVLQTGWDSSNKDLFKKVLFRLWDTTAREHPSEWKRLYKELKSKDEFERMSEVGGLEPASELTESEAIPYQTPPRGNDKTYTQRAFGISFRISHRMKKFNRWDLMTKYTKNASEMQKYSKDVEAAKLWNDPTGASYTFKGYDTLDFAENAHTGLLAGSTADNYDNYLDQDLSHASIQTAEVYFADMIDSMGHVMPTVPDTLVVPTALTHTANEIYRSDKKSGEFSNTANVLNREVDVFTYHFFTSTTAWYLLAKNNSKYDVNMITTQEPDKEMHDAYDNTRDTIFTSLQYFEHGFGDPRMVYCGNG